MRQSAHNSFVTAVTSVAQSACRTINAELNSPVCGQCVRQWLVTSLSSSLLLNPDFQEDIMNSFRSLNACLLSAVIVLGLAGSAIAQHGHGGGHSGGSHHGGGTTHHHGGGYYGGYGYSGLRFGFGYGSGFGYGGYPYGYGSGLYSTPRYYYSTPTYSVPTYSYPSTVIINSTPVAPAPSFDNGPIVIMSPAANDQPIEYTLNGQSFTMKPGQSQKFNHDRDWIVGFNRGDGKGTAQYGLKAAMYKFKKTANGWELFEAAIPEPPATSSTNQGEAPKPIDLVSPVEQTVRRKTTTEAPAPAPAKSESDAK